MFYGPVSALFREMSIEIFGSIFKIKLFMCVFYIELHELFLHFGVKSHLEGCLLLSIRISFAVQMLLKLIRSHLFIFVLFFISVSGG